MKYSGYRFYQNEKKRLAEKKGDSEPRVSDEDNRTARPSSARLSGFAAADFLDEDYPKVEQPVTTNVPPLTPSTSTSTVTHNSESDTDNFLDHLKFNPNEQQVLRNGETVMRESNQDHDTYPTYTFYHLIDCLPSQAAKLFLNPKKATLFIPDCQSVEVNQSTANATTVTYKIGTGLVWPAPTTLDLKIENTQVRSANNENVKISSALKTSSVLEKNKGFIQFQTVTLPNSEQSKTLVTYQSHVLPKSLIRPFAPAGTIQAKTQTAFENIINMIKASSNT
jgi:hypothetical protein